MSNCLSNFGNLMCPCSYTEMLAKPSILCFKSQILIGSVTQYLKFINLQKAGLLPEFKVLLCDIDMNVHSDL